MITFLKKIANFGASVLHRAIDRNVDYAMNQLNQFRAAKLNLLNNRMSIGEFEQLDRAVTRIADRNAEATSLREVFDVYIELHQMVWRNRRKLDIVEDDLNLHNLYSEMLGTAH